MSDDHHHMKWLHKYSMDFFDNPLPDNAPPVKGLTARDIRGAFAEYETLRAENERLREPVTVKPLAWEDFSERSSKATAMLLSSYMVQRWSCGRFDLSISAPGYSTGLEGAGGFYDTMDAAKAAAQADFESRIRAALETKKAPGDDAEG